MTEIKGLFPLILVLLGIYGTTKLHTQEIIYDSIFYGLESYFELSDALEDQSFFSLVVNKIAMLYEDFEESVLRHLSEAMNKKKEGSSEIDKHKARYNFASINGGAKIIQTKPSVKLGKSILDDAIDNYALYDCRLEPLEIVISLTEDVLIDSIMILNTENHASFFKDFEVKISTKYQDTEWLPVGIFQTEDKKEWQFFPIPQKWARYVKLKLINHHGNEGLCTITQIKVLGTTMLENFRDEFLIKDDSHFTSGVFDETEPTHFKPQPPKPPEYSIFLNQANNTSPNDMLTRLNHGFPHGTNFPGPSTIISQDDSDDDHENSIKYDHKNHCFYADYLLSNWGLRSDKRSQIIDKNYHRNLNNTPISSRKFKYVALKMLSHLFEVPFSRIYRKAVNFDIDIDIQSTSLAEVNNANQLISSHQFYGMGDTIARKIFSQHKNLDPHESIFRTLSKRIKVLEQSALLLENLLNLHKQNSNAEIINLNKRIQEAEDGKSQLRKKVGTMEHNNLQLVKRIESIEKTLREMNSFSFMLSNISLTVLLFVVLHIAWRILEKSTFSPPEPPKKPIIQERVRNERRYDSLTPKTLHNRKKNKVSFKETPSPKSGTVMTTSKSMTDLHRVSPPRRSKSPTGSFSSSIKGKWG